MVLLTATLHGCCWRIPRLGIGKMFATRSLHAPSWVVCSADWLQRPLRPMAPGKTSIQRCQYCRSSAGVHWLMPIFWDAQDCLF